MMISRRAVVATGLTLPFLAVPGRAQSKPGHLRFGLSAWPPNLQPWVTTGASAGTVKMLIHRSLISYDNKGELAGELARVMVARRATAPGSSSCGRTRCSTTASPSPPTT